MHMNHDVAFGHQTKTPPAHVMYSTTIIMRHGASGVAGALAKTTEVWHALLDALIDLWSHDAPYM